MFKLALIGAWAIALSASVALAGASEPQYHLKRVSGPRNHIYQLVRVEPPREIDTPYALTGQEPERRRPVRTVNPRRLPVVSYPTR